MNLFQPKEYWEKRLKQKYTLQGVGFTKLGWYYNFWLYKIRKAVFFKQIKPLIHKKHYSSVLDIGSGTGFYIPLWQSLNIKKITASDITDYAVAKIKEKYPFADSIPLDVGVQINSTMKKKRYTIISAFDILFHIVDNAKYEKAIKNIHQLLETNGLFIFTENLVEGDPDNKTHYISRNFEYIEKLLQKTGFKIIKKQPVFIIMNNPIAMKNSFIKFIWKLFMLPIYLIPFLGAISGAMLYPIELLLLQIVKKGYSTQLVICEKK